MTAEQWKKVSRYFGYGALYFGYLWLMLSWYARKL